MGTDREEQAGGLLDIKNSIVFLSNVIVEEHTSLPILYRWSAQNYFIRYVGQASLLNVHNIFLNFSTLVAAMIAILLRAAEHMYI